MDLLVQEQKPYHFGSHNSHEMMGRGVNRYGTTKGNEKACVRCEGSGKFGLTNCGSCGGSGKMNGMFEIVKH